MELALVLPVFLLVVLIGLDFGRIYLGYVTLQQAARIGANFAAVNPTAWGSPGIALDRTRYQQLLANETANINCDFPNPAPNPQFPDGTDVGQRAVVTLDCHFHILTPIIAAILPNPLTASASAVFPIRVGFTNRAPGSGGPTPLAAFATLPSNGTIVAGGSIQFIDSSQNNPTVWTWDFGDASPQDNGEFPSHVYANPSGYTVNYTATLNACNINGCSTATGVIHVQSATPAATACFTTSPNPPTGPVQLTVNFANCSTGAAPITYAWDFDNNGTVDSTATSPPHTYTTAGTYTAKLTATNAYNTSPSSVTATITVTAAQPTCIVPTFTGNDPISTGSGQNKNKWTTSDVNTVWTTINAAKWSGGNCHGSIIYTGGSPTSGQFFKIDTQSLFAGSIQFQSTPITFTWH